MGQYHSEVMIYINDVELELLVFYANFQDHKTLDSVEEDFILFYLDRTMESNLKGH